MITFPCLFFLAAYKDQKHYQTQSIESIHDGNEKLYQFHSYNMYKVANFCEFYQNVYEYD